jgi:hypothetical protein
LWTRKAQGEFLVREIRKPQAYFDSNQNAEEWPARFVRDGEQILVGESLSMYVSSDNENRIGDIDFIKEIL